MYEAFGWTYDNMFVLTRDHPVEVTVVGDEDLRQKWTLYYYGNQVLNFNDVNEKIDKFGRNYIDKLFIALCLALNILSLSPNPDIRFKSLRCWKDGEQYFARVQYDDEDVTMELSEAERYFQDMLMAKIAARDLKEQNDMQN